MARKRKSHVFHSNGRVFAYIRVSSGMQAKSGLGLMAQSDVCIGMAASLELDFAKTHYDPAKPPREGFFVDAGETAFKLRFEQRAAGKRLLEVVEPGDTIIVSRLDRAFRNVVDFITVSSDLIARGIRLVVCSPSINMGSANGRMLARHLANMAEWESDRKGERIRDALAAKKERNELTKAIVADKLENAESDWRPIAAEESDTPATDEPGRIFIYIRCSHRDSAASGLGMIVQADIARRKAAQLILRNPNLGLTEIFTDAAVSALKINLRERVAGKEMNEHLQAGDHVIFSTLDRGFRSIMDMAETIPNWIQRGIHIHFAAEELSMDDPAGRMMANVVVVFAQYESELTSQRNKEARAQLAIRGKFVGGREPPFWKVYKSKGVKKLVLDRKQIAAFRLIQMYRGKGMKLREAMERVETFRAKRENRPPLPQLGVTKESKFWQTLPKDYEIDEHGKAFPMFTHGRYHIALKGYPAAVEAWRKKAAEERRLKNLEDCQVEPLPIEKKLHSGWPVGQNPGNDERSITSRSNRQPSVEERIE